MWLGPRDYTTLLHAIAESKVEYLPKKRGSFWSSRRGAGSELEGVVRWHQFQGRGRGRGGMAVIRWSFMVSIFASASFSLLYAFCY